MKIIHIVTSEKFIPPFIELIENNFDINQHYFAFITSEKYQFDLKRSEHIGFFHRDQDFIDLNRLLFSAEKIILHGIWREKVNQLLIASPVLLTKTYWFMWGGEFYYPERYSDAHISVIKHSAFLVSGVSGDIDLVREKYGAQGQFIEGMVYAKFHRLVPLPYTSVKSETQVLIGNSGAASNHHLDAISIVAKHKDNIGNVYIPLSYGGSAAYIKAVEDKGLGELSTQFTPMKDYLSLQAYLNFLTTIDIAVFNHDRQQGINNILILLELGKKIYMRTEVSTFIQLTQKGFHIFDIKKFNTQPISAKQATENNLLVKKYYSKEKTLEVLKSIFQAK